MQCLLFEIRSKYMNDFDNHAKLFVKEGITYPNAVYTHPLKQVDLQNIYNTMLKDSNVRLLVVFGSTVNMICHSNSDIDLYIELQDNNKVPVIPDSVISDVDLIYNVSKASGIYKSIDRDGIVLFDRRK